MVTQALSLIYSQDHASLILFGKAGTKRGEILVSILAAILSNKPFEMFQFNQHQLVISPETKAGGQGSTHLSWVCSGFCSQLPG